jgi:hypothetical protein
MQLTEDEQQQIKAEEVYRAEVQRQLKLPEPQTRWGKFIAFLNTPLGLWLLSSLLLGGLAAAYTDLQSYFAGRHQSQMKIEQLNYQLAMKIDYSLSLLQKAHASNSGPKPSDETKKDYVLVLNTFLDDEPETRLSPDFKDRSTLSLVYELKNIDKSHFPQTGEHSYEILIGYIGDLMQARQGLISDAYNNLTDKERQELLTTVDGTMDKINKQ